MEPEELSTYRKTEEMSGIDRLFLSLASIFGKRWFDFWAGSDMPTVKSTWTRGLKGIQGYQIRDALDYVADNAQFVPDLPAFKKICDGMKKQEVQQAIERKFTKEEMENNHQRMQHELGKLRIDKHEVGHKAWAHRILANPKAYPDISVKYAQEALQS
jgi:hypothetical protein